MPRYTPSQLRWSEQAQGYVFSVGDQTSTQALSSDWLEQIASFSLLEAQALCEAVENHYFQLRSLLPQLHDQPLLAYIRTLLSAFPVQERRGTQTLASPLVEPLSPQEMRVLRLLVQHRSNADIANELVVSVNTVRTQVQSIYRKLGVHTRSAASEVARELHLI
jgi:DNA-binding NarL/FixJ family response regulator